MKCDEFQLLIEDYADGALAEKASSLVTSHMATCEPCSTFYQELSREQEVYARYERDIDVTPLLWSSIEARIKKERAARPLRFVGRWREMVAGAFAAPRLTPAFVSALVIVAIGLTVVVMSYLNSTTRSRGQIAITVDQPGKVETRPSNDSPTKGEKVTPPPTIEPGAPATVGGGVASAPINVIRAPRKSVVPATSPSPAQLVREAEQKYQTAIAILSRDVNRQRSQLDPILLARFDAALGEIDKTIKETQRVVRENPEDPIALQYLLAAYSKKVDMLRGMTTD